MKNFELHEGQGAFSFGHPYAMCLFPSKEPGTKYAFVDDPMHG